MDLALAHVLRQRLEASGYRIDTWQLHGLWHQCRMAKEKLFESPKMQSRPITLLGKGTKLVGGTIKTELAREDLDRSWSKDSSPKSRVTNYPHGNAALAFRNWACRTRPILPSPNTSRGFCRSSFAIVPRRQASGAAAADWHVPRTSCSTAE